jgi:hypothetical protein
MQLIFNRKVSRRSALRLCPFAGFSALFGPFRPVLYRCGHELGTSIPPHIGSAIALRTDLSPTRHVDRHSTELVVHRRPLCTSLARWQRMRSCVHLDGQSVHISRTLLTTGQTHNEHRSRRVRARFDAARHGSDRFTLALTLNVLQAIHQPNGATAECLILTGLSHERQLISHSGHAQPFAPRALRMTIGERIGAASGTSSYRDQLRLAIAPLSSAIRFSILRMSSLGRASPTHNL